MAQAIKKKKGASKLDHWDLPTAGDIPWQDVVELLGLPIDAECFTDNERQVALSEDRLVSVKRDRHTWNVDGVALVGARPDDWDRCNQVVFQKPLPQHIAISVDDGTYSSDRALSRDKSLELAKEGDLFEAALLGATQIVDTLLQKGADANTRKLFDHLPEVLTSSSCGVWGVTGQWGHYFDPITIAAGAGHIAVVRLLIDRGADLFYANSTWAVALVNGHFELAEMLAKHINKRRNPGNCIEDAFSNTLVESALAGRTTAVDYLLSRKANPSARGRTVRYFGGEMAPLVAAALGDSAKTVRLLLERGSDVNADDSYGRTAWIVAAARGRQDILAMLEVMQQRSATPMLSRRYLTKARILCGNRWLGYSKTEVAPSTCPTRETGFPGRRLCRSPVK